MNSIKKYISLGAMAICAIILAACSTDTELVQTDTTINIHVGAFPAFDSGGMETRSVGTYDTGKSAWANGDKILVKITNPSNNGSLVGTSTLTYNGTEWSWTGEQIKIDVATADITAYYAPAYEWSTASAGNLTLLDTKTAGTDEYLVYKATGVSLSKGISIDFSQTARTYSRLRVAAAAGKEVSLTCSDFIANDGSTTAATAITSTTDSKGNAYFYGTWTANAQLSLKADWYEFTKTAAASDAGKSYAINGVKAVKVGDIYFADGSWGTQAERTGKTPVAVVYYAGDPTNDDAALKRDHPGCTHGLAVALNNYNSKGPWQLNYKAYGKTVGSWIDTSTNNQYVSTVVPFQTVGNLNKILGYNNTKAIEAFNADAANSAWKVEVVENVVTYRAQVTAPSASSDWYVPSPKEWHLIGTAGDYSKDACEYYGNDKLMIAEINNVLTTISEATAIGATSNYPYYWCSSEQTENSANFFYVSNCEVGDYSSKENKSAVYAIRFTLAF